MFPAKCVQCGIARLCQTVQIVMRHQFEQVNTGILQVRAASAAKNWEVMFQALLEYKQAHGDCLVPQQYKENRKLGDWVSEQRMAYSRERLAPERVQRLNEIVFEWDPIGTRWEEMFQQLMEFKKEHGHTDVPQLSAKYRKLGQWVRSQRAGKRLNRPILANRIARLEQLGFKWRLVDPNSWESMIDRLVEFKRVHGHCKVPQKWPADKRLGRWVNSLRFRKQHLKKHQIEHLESIGFVWNTKRPNLEENV